VPEAPFGFCFRAIGAMNCSAFPAARISLVADLARKPSPACTAVDASISICNIAAIGSRTTQGADDQLLRERLGDALQIRRTPRRRNRLGAFVATG
jgi:hypothetical protein